MAIISSRYQSGRVVDQLGKGAHIDWWWSKSRIFCIWIHGCSDTSAATQHFVKAGYSESRGIDGFSASNYLSLNIYLQIAFGSDLNAATQHYILTGFNEGRAIWI